ncbi:UDP-N-acetylmuramate dehydrogenase [Candidatus Peregrinibacteria bacterium]|jgi:UDP-N-acetylmuramate dehydrogenase|nr:UDP-N-acetylmuramate dehydrogenase [Candidatus Peregrinibacteria bacterium]
MNLLQIENVRENVSLKPYCTYGVGGEARFFYELADVDQLEMVLAAAREDNVAVFIFGGGSNVLFLDEGYPGLVIRVVANEVRVEENYVIAEAGAKWPAVIAAAREAGLCGLESFEGLPGTLGGAVVGNAGCFGTEIKDVFASAMIYDLKKNKVREVGPEYFEFSYRWSRIKETKAVILSVKLCLDKGEIKPVKACPDTMAARFEKQPPGKSGGSFFKNPSPDQPAGKLIDECGLKGHQIGGSKISEKHANFFMNDGGGTAAELLELGEVAKSAVREKFGVELKEEVMIARAQTV